MNQPRPVSSEEIDPADFSRGRLQQLLAYGQKVYGLSGMLNRVRDRRRKPAVAAGAVTAAVFYAGLLRIRSFNALEPRLSEPGFRRLARGASEESLGSADTLSRALRVMDLDTVRGVSLALLSKAERNKVFREGWRGALRYVAVDGWEPISSRKRHCKECLVRKVKVKGSDGEIREVEEYYHLSLIHI